MNALVLTLFVGAVLLAFSLVSFVAAAKRGDHEHNDRLSMLPLESEPALATALSPSPALSPAPSPAKERP